MFAYPANYLPVKPGYRKLFNMNEIEPIHVEPNNPTQFSAVPWTPLIGLLSMAVLTGVLLTYVVNHAQHSTFARLAACLTWSISVLFFAGSALVTFVTAFKVIWKELQSIKLLIDGFVLFAITGAITLSLLPGIVQELQFNKILLDGVYDFAPASKIFVSIVQILGTLALVALAVAVSLILFRSRSDTYAHEKKPVVERVVSLARDQNLVRKLLYVGALTLVAGTLQASALYSWGITLMPSADILPDLVNYDSSKPTGIPQLMGAFNGAFYSILLAVIFVPAFIQLGEIADRLVGEESPNATEPERNAWFVNHALDYSVPRQLFSALAILSPLLAGGPLTSLLEVVAR